MPSPFPGMDPFIEGQAWSDFHHRFIGIAADALTPHTRPRYVVRIEERVYLEHHPEESERLIVPDLSVAEPVAVGSPPRRGTGAAVAEPVILTLPVPRQEREHFLTIRMRETLEVVTIIEVLSPINKRRGSDGRHEYLSKRDVVLCSATHLVELDLLRGGERLPTIEPLPPGDYYALVSPAARRPNTLAFHWTLQQRMPVIPVPLAAGDPDVELDLQTAFDTVYSRSDYEDTLDYGAPVKPPLIDADADWFRQALAER